MINRIKSLEGTIKQQYHTDFAVLRSENQIEGRLNQKYWYNKQSLL